MTFRHTLFKLVLPTHYSSNSFLHSLTHLHACQHSSHPRPTHNIRLNLPHLTPASQPKQPGQSSKQPAGQSSKQSAGKKGKNVEHPDDVEEETGQDQHQQPEEAQQTTQQEEPMTVEKLMSTMSAMATISATQAVNAAMDARFGPHIPQLQDGHNSLASINANRLAGQFSTGGRPILASRHHTAYPSSSLIDATGSILKPRLQAIPVRPVKIITISPLCSKVKT